MSTWTDSIVGQRYRAHGVELCLCTAYEPRSGFWMHPEDGAKPRNVSEYAIGRTFHAVNEADEIVDARRAELLATKRCERCGDTCPALPCATCAAYGLV